MAEQEEDFSSLPLTERWVHKNWKVRKEAYEGAAKEFSIAASENDPTVRTFVQDPGLWKAAVADSNVAAQQEALASLCAFLDIGGIQGCIRTRGLTIPSIVEKGLAATRPAAKQKALEAILLYIELDKADPIIEELLPILSHKLPKIIAATLACLKEIYHAYGCKIVEPKPVLKILPKVFGHADKNVRAEAQNLTVELYRWLKEAMKPLFWNELKPVQQQDLDKLFEKVKDDPPPKQERLLRSQQDIPEAAPTASGGGEAVGDDEEEAEIDLEPEFEAVNVMAKIPKDLHERLSSSKWKDRKEALEDLQKAIDFPKIEEGHFDEIMRALAKCMKDANIAVVSLAANCIEIFAKGLKKSFSKYRSTVMVSIMERLKEKKQSVTDALSAALDAVFAATGLSECLEEVLEKLKDKNPQVKLESTRFLIRSLKTTREVPKPDEVKMIADASKALLTDAQATQRDAGAEVLGTLWKIMGDRMMGAHLEGLDEIRKTKIKELHDAAEVKAKYKPKAAAPPPKAAAAPPGKRPTPGGVKKAAPGLKKPVSAPRAPSPIEEPAAPALAPRPTTRPGLAKPGAPKSGIAAPGGLRAPGLQKRLPGAVASPARKVASPVEAPAPPTPAQPKFGAGRGLVNRPLGKPTALQSPPSPESMRDVSSSFMGMSSAERAELDELRSEADRLRRENEMLRNEKARLNSQIYELTSQNAQLIEDHTRDVLTIKAKETQLVRARSAQDTAEDLAAERQREIDRLKRELSRQVRAPSPSVDDHHHQIYHDNNSGTNGMGMGMTGLNGNGYNSRVRSYVTSPTSDSGMSGGSGKENNMPGLSLRQKLSSPPSVPAPAPPAEIMSRYGANAYSNGGAPASPRMGSRAEGEGLIPRPTSTQTSSLGASSNGGPESWKRAAEVTQNLKARIEQMKAKQGLSRQH